MALNSVAAFPPLVWIDLEMTGLDVKKERILEIAVILTDSDLNLLAKGPDIAVHHPPHVLSSMEDWSLEHHGRSGLTARAKASPYDTKSAEAEVLKFLRREGVEANRSPLCGNSVWNDRKFLEAYMPELAGFLHYRNVDVSSLKELVTRWYPEREPFRKLNAHTALSDIEESIAELKYYREAFFLQKSKGGPS